MSSRELRALLADKPENSSVVGRTRLLANLASHSSEPNMAKTERIADLESALRDGQQKLKEQKDELEEAKKKEGQLSERLKAVETELNNSMKSRSYVKLRKHGRKNVIVRRSGEWT